MGTWDGPGCWASCEVKAHSVPLGDRQGQPHREEHEAEGKVCVRSAFPETRSMSRRCGQKGHLGGGTAIVKAQRPPRAAQLWSEEQAWFSFLSCPPSPLPLLSRFPSPFLPATVFLSILFLFYLLVTLTLILVSFPFQIYPNRNRKNNHISKLQATPSTSGMVSVSQ